MNIRSSSIKALAALLLGAALCTHAKPNTQNLVHYSVDEAFVPTGLDADASGRVQVLTRQDGDVGHDRFRIVLAHLDPRASYTLLALVGTETNLTPVTNFTTTAQGRAALTYTETASAKNKAKRAGKPHPHALPEVLGDLSGVRALAVANADGAIVLSVDLYASSSLSFELATVFDNTGTDPEAIGCLAMSAVNGNVQFRLFAAGQGNQLTFCVNDSPVATYNTDSDGRISVGVFPATAPSPLLFRSICVRNAGNETVLQSTVP